MAQDFVRLREEFLPSFPWNNFRREQFTEWARRTRTPRLFGVNNHILADLRGGRPVTYEVGHAFYEYLILHQLIDPEKPFEDIAAPCEAHEPSGKDSADAFDPWDAARASGGTHWKRMFVGLTRQFEPDPLSYCRDEEDFARGARIIMERVGAHNDKFAKGDDAIKAASDAMKTDFATYVQFLRMAWEPNRHAVMFPTEHIKGETRRLGVSVVLPISPHCFADLEAGMEPADITAADLLPKSNFLHMNAMAESRELDNRSSRSSRRMAMASTLLYQIASLAPRLSIDDDIHLATFGGTPETARRQRIYNFVPTGSVTSRTGKAVVRFGPPGQDAADRATRQLLRTEYFVMHALVQFYQRCIASIAGTDPA